MASAMATDTTDKRRSCRDRPPIAPAALDAGQIDAVEQHLQVGGADLDAGGVAAGKAERAGFEALVDDHKTVLDRKSVV